MAAFLLSLLLLLFSLSSASHHHTPSSPAAARHLPPPQKSSTTIHEACKASRDPSSCETWLSQSGHVPLNATVLQVIQSGLSLISQNLNKGKDMVQGILKSSAGNKNRSTAAATCLEMVGYSAHRIETVNTAVATAPMRSQIKEARVGTSAALVYQYDCWSALKYVNDTAEVVKTMSFFNYTLIASTSSVLAMLVNYDVYSDRTGSWGPVRTERDGFWEPVPNRPRGSSTVGGVPPLKADATVCKDGGGCKYTTVQDAVNAAPDNLGPGKWFVIRIKAGVYKETVRVPLEKKNVVFLGDGLGKTVITGSRFAGQPGMSTYNSATVGVVGDGFMATGLTIKNTAGPDAHQAVAFRSDSDRSIIEKCEFLGNQDTLYAHSLRQYYKSCIIQGNVDFIFGNSAAYFDECTILIAPRQLNPEKGEKNAVTAHGRVDPAQSTGFVFQHCVINGTDEYVRLYRSNPKVHTSFLGRPWKTYSRTVFIRSSLGEVVSPEGWLPWDGNQSLSTCYYGEFKNVGPGSGTKGRVAWSSQIPAAHIGAYSVQNFVQGDQWIKPSTGADN